MRFVISSRGILCRFHYFFRMFSISITLLSCPFPMSFHDKIFSMLFHDCRNPFHDCGNPFHDCGNPFISSLQYPLGPGIMTCTLYMHAYRPVQSRRRRMTETGHVVALDAGATSDVLMSLSLCDSLAAGAVHSRTRRAAH